jgi:hypothetical protein
LDRKETYQLLTALADNEIADPSEREKLFSLLDTDPDYKYEYAVQTLMKSIVKEKSSFIPAPKGLFQKIEFKLKNETIFNKNFQRKSGFFSQPFIKYGTAAAIIFAVFLLIFNWPPPVTQTEFAIEQAGEDNMFVQAKNNFHSILEGKLAPQMTSNKSEEINGFFIQNGVKYSTLIPEFENWQLLGAVVSEDQGEKFAHHVYSSSSGEVAYLFQVDESYIQSHKILRLSENLMEYLDEGNCYSYTENETVILMTKAENNIIAVVSNASPEEINNNFCLIN